MIRVKRWDCIYHYWAWFWEPVHQPFSATLFRLVRSKIHWGEVWLIWFGIPIKHIPKEEYEAIYASVLKKAKIGDPKRLAKAKLRNPTGGPQKL